MVLGQQPSWLPALPPGFDAPPLHVLSCGGRGSFQWHVVPFASIMDASSGKEDEYDFLFKGSVGADAFSCVRRLTVRTPRCPQLC